MASGSTNESIASTRLSLGGEQAEADPLLNRAFYESADYSSIASKEDPHCFLIGRTGSGKSAALSRLEAISPSHVIRIDPEDLSLPYITDLSVIQALSHLDVHLDPFFIALWKHVLLVEIIRHRYSVNTPDAKQNFLAALRDKILRDTSKKNALEYLDQFGEKFWCETDERVREITDKFEEEVESAGSLGASLANAASLEGATKNRVQATA